MRHTRLILRAFLGRPKLPGYKHQTNGRNLIVFERGAVWKGSLKHGEIAVSQLGLIALTRVKREQVDQVRVVPKDGYYVVEVIYTCESRQASVDPALFVAVDIGVNVLAMLTSHKAGFVPQLVNGRPLKAVNQFYNKQRGLWATPPGPCQRQAPDLSFP